MDTWFLRDCLRLIRAASFSGRSASDDQCSPLFTVNLHRQHSPDHSTRHVISIKDFVSSERVFFRMRTASSSSDRQGVRRFGFIPESSREAARNPRRFAIRFRPQVPGHGCRIAEQDIAVETIIYAVFAEDTDPMSESSCADKSRLLRVDPSSRLSRMRRSGAPAKPGRSVHMISPVDRNFKRCSIWLMPQIEAYRSASGIPQ